MEEILYKHGENISVFSDFGMVEYWLKDLRNKLPKETTKDVLDKFDFISQTCHNTYVTNKNM
tara:strand:- start:698 stop:883 length:186 start_codon:yes stop_codon:yes gene_type:complete